MRIQIQISSPDNAATKSDSTKDNGMKSELNLLKIMCYLSIFFSIFIFFCLTIGSDVKAPIKENKNNYYRLCSEIDSHEEIPTITCIRDDELEATFELITIIEPILHDMPIAHEFKDTRKPYLLSGADVIRIGGNKEVLNQQPSLTILLRNMEYLIDKNPHWKLCNVNDNGRKLNFDEVLKLRTECGTHFAAIEPRIPFSCSLVFNALISILLVSVTLYIIYEHIEITREMTPHTINYIVDEILAHLMTKAEFETEYPCIAINDLRDKILPDGRGTPSWNKAVNYLESSENQIQFGTTIINGEIHKTLKWNDIKTEGKKDI